MPSFSSLVHKCSRSRCQGPTSLFHLTAPAANVSVYNQGFMNQCGVGTIYDHWSLGSILFRPRWVCRWICEEGDMRTSQKRIIEVVKLRERRQNKFWYISLFGGKAHMLCHLFSIIKTTFQPLKVWILTPHICWVGPLQDWYCVAWCWQFDFFQQKIGINGCLKGSKMH